MAVLSELNAETFDSAVLSSKLPVMVDFWAPWCGPCRMVSPIMERLAETYAGKVSLGKVNVDEEGALAAKYGVMSIPTVILFQNGEIVETSTGAYPQTHFEQMIERTLQK